VILFCLPRCVEREALIREKTRDEFTSTRRRVFVQSRENILFKRKKVYRV